MDWKAEPSIYEPVPGQRLPGFAFTFEAERKRDYFVIKVIIPLVLIVMMSWVVFFTDPGDSGTDIGVAVTSMLTLIAYRFAVGTSLPVISYLTRLDYFILGATILVFFNLAEVLVAGYMVRAGHKQWAINLDRGSRVCFPAAFAYITAHSFFFGFASS